MGKAFTFYVSLTHQSSNMPQELKEVLLEGLLSPNQIVRLARYVLLFQPPPLQCNCVPRTCCRQRCHQAVQTAERIPELSRYIKTEIRIENVQPKPRHEHT